MYRPYNLLGMQQQQQRAAACSGVVVPSHAAGIDRAVQSAYRVQHAKQLQHGAGITLVTASVLLQPPSRF
ncbi:hypothetical protein B566_EDAN001239 [Ephemera danica]|nr:hypothetical protein B566_EDAN001239 [Ephemera danica]